FYFDNGDIVEILKPDSRDLFGSKESKSDEASSVIEVRRVSSSTSAPDSFKISSTQAVPPLNRYLSFLVPAGPDSWYDTDDDEVVTTAEVIARYGPHLPPGVRKSLIEVPEWLKAIIDSCDCRLIETQRLLRFPRFEESGRGARRASASAGAVVEME